MLDHVGGETIESHSESAAPLWDTRQEEFNQRNSDYSLYTSSQLKHRSTMDNPLIGRDEVIVADMGAVSTG